MIAGLFAFLSSNAQTVLLSESFEGTFPPTGWVIQNNGAGNNWILSTANAYSGTNSMEYAYNVNSAADAWAYTPLLNLKATQVTVTFWTKVGLSGYPESMKLTVGNDSTVASQVTTLMDSASITNTGYRRWTATYTPSAAGNYRFAFNCYSIANQYNLYVDSITITQVQPPCTGTPVAGSAISSLTSICNANAFLLSDTGSTTGVSGLTYQWQSSPDGTAWTNIVGATAATDSIKNQATATYYRRITTCSASSVSANSISVLVGMNPNILCVCSPTNGTTLHSAAAAPAIDTVSIVGTVLNNITSTTVPAGGYTLYTDTTKMPSLQQSMTYSLKTSYSANAIGSVWFDWNHSGTFDSSEWKQINTTGTRTTISFTVPAGASLGKTLMRVRSKSTTGGGTNTALNACTSFTTGETEDYLINIIAPIQCTGTPNGGTVITSANPICSSVNLVLTDTGATSGVGGLSYQWQSSINGTSWTDINGATAATDTVKGLATATYFRRVTTCAGSGLSGNSNSVQVNVNPTILCVCSPTNGTTLHSAAAAPAVDTVIIAGTVLNFANGTTVPTGGYKLSADTTKMPSLQQAQTYTLQTSYSANAIGSVWFDWNQSGTFDSSEWKQINTTGTRATISFTVPVSANLGKSLMRIRSKSTTGGGTNTALNACTSFTTGETEDYLINVIAPIQCTGTPNGGTVVTSANPICSSVNLVLTDTGATSGVGGLSYQWQSSTNGTSWTDINGATAVTDTVKGLATATYFRRATTCAGSGLNGNSNSVQVNINPAILCVCSPTNGTTLHSAAAAPTVDTVIIVGSPLNTTHGTTVPAGGYILSTDTTMMPTLEVLKTYSLHTSYSAAAIGSVWFDWNQSGTFDSTEWSQITTNGTTATLNFTVPANANIGKTLMRIRSKRTPGAGTNTALNACTSFTTGETEDYLINVIPPVQCTGTPNGGTVITSANPICSSANLVLTDTGATSGVGGLSYQWQSSVNGTSWTDITGATAVTDTVKGLATATYFRRVTTCAGSGLSGNSNSVQVNINPTILCVCSPTNGTTLHSAAAAPAVDTVIIAGTVLNITHGTTVPAGGYVLSTDTTLMPTLEVLKTYSLHTSYSAASIGSVWFDWNQSGTFDSTEWSQITTNGTTATLNFTVPANASIGKTLMRIRSKRTPGAGTNTALNACTSFTTGETEDYLINVIPPVQCTGTPNGGTVITSANPICSIVNLVLTDTGATSGVGGLSYQWQSSANGTSWTNISGATAVTDTVKGLATATYFRRVTTCAGSGLSGNSNSVQVNINPTILCVCSPATGTNLHSAAVAPAVDTVIIAGTPLNVTHGTTVPTGGYVLSTDTTLMPTLEVLKTYSLHTSYSAATIGSVWFDWNQSGSFDSTEWIQINTTGTAATINFTVPANASIGKTLMRIRSKRTPGAGTNTALNACTSFTTGETEDYLINVTPPVQCTGTPNGGAVITSANPICVSANLILTDTTATSGVGGLTYQWQYSADSTNWNNITGATATSDTVKGLATTTFFRRITTCSNSGLIGYSAGVKVTINPFINCVCSPSTGVTLHSAAAAPAVDTVIIAGTTLNFANGTTVPAGGYKLSTDTTKMPSLQQAQSYTLQTSYSANAIGSVWFDWNQSGTFDSSEWKQINTTGTRATISFTVPANASLGKSLMRIRSKSNIGGGTNTALNACTSFTTGETEDYLINIIAPIQCTGTPNPGAVITSANPVCANANLVLTDTTATAGIAGLTYQWQSSSDSATWTNLVGATAITDTIKGLAITTYFRRITTCSNSSLSANTSGIKVTMNPFINCVCSPSTGITLHSTPSAPAVDTVIIAGTPLNVSNGTTIPTGGYKLSTDTTLMPTLQQFQTYSLQTNFSVAAVGSVWFDWNQSGTFDSTEWIQITANGTRATINFTVPGNASLGKTLMRIRSKRSGGGGTNTALNACTSFTSGVTEDYLINVVPATQCFGTPTAGAVITSANPICTSANLVLNDTTATTGLGGLTYQWQSSPDSSTWTNITGGTNIKDTIKGLATSTYFRRVITCNISSLSATTTAVKVTVNPFINCVCSPTTGVTLHSAAAAPAIDTVIIVGSVLNNTSATTVAAGGYTLYSDTTFMPALQQLQTYTLQTSYSANAIGSVWFDWNQSGSFDSSEWKQINTTGTKATITFTVPATASLGKTLMRIRSKSNIGGGTNTALNACTSFTTGETEDYLINITAAAICSGTPNAGTVIASANPICSSVNLVLTDTGSTTGVAGITSQWQYSANGTTWSDITGATGNTDTVKGLATATYFRRVTTCASSGLKGNSNALLVNVNPTILCVCSPASGSILHSAAAAPAVDTVAITGTTLNYTFPTTVATGGYILNTDTTKMPSLQQQVTYTLQTSFSANAIASVWFDWNQSGSFDSSEWKQISTTGTKATITFTVPANASLGKALMRIRSKSTVGGGTNTALNACTSFTTGETEDFLINVLPAPTCWAPVNPSVANISSTGGTVSWTAPAVVPSNGYIVSYSATNNYTTATVAGTNVTLDSFKLTGLNSNTLYYVWVLGNCGTSVSVVSTTSFTTNCGSITTLPLNEGFESIAVVGAGAVPKCWSSTFGTGGTNITSATAAIRNGIGARTGTHYVWARNNSSAWLISPAIHLSAGQSYSFSYYYRPVDTLKSFTLNNFIGTAADTTSLSANNLGTITLIGDSSTYHLATYNYTPTTTGDYYFSIQSVNNNGTRSYMCFDDISVISNIPVYQVQGNIVYPTGVPVPNTTLNLTGTKVDSALVTGPYTFSEVSGGNYTLRASKNNDVNKANGVTSLDLALTQSHILGKTIFNSPYKIIAADVNGDKKISTLDLVYMKRLILGIDTVYPTKRLWVFVDSNYVFPDPANPFPYKDSISFIDLTGNHFNQTFIGIKLGDVNWDWNPLVAKPASTPASKIKGELKLETDDKVILK